MKSLRRKGLPTLVVLGALSFSAIGFVPVALAVPQTFVVNSVADSSDANAGDGICETSTASECTLRAAIEESNANAGADTINFNIPGDPSTVHVIEPATHNLGIDDEVHINGYSQPGASANTAIAPNPINAEIRIELKGTTPTDNSAGLGFVPGSEGSSVRGLSIYDFAKNSDNDATPSAMNIAISAADVSVSGNFIGLRADGMTVATGQNHNGIIIAESAVNVTIGGTNPEDRNIFYNYGIHNAAAALFGGSEGSVVYGNYFGLAADGVTDLTPTGEDVEGLQGPWSIAINLVSASQNPGNIGTRVGGPSTGMRNVISGGTVGVVLSSDGNIVQGNYIGTDYTGQVNENISHGVGTTTTAGSYNLIGGTNPGEGNVIAGVRGAGVMNSSFDIVDAQFTLTPVEISILGNSIYDIGVFGFSGFGDANQGIDLIHMIDESPSNFVPDIFQQRGPNLNDVGDGDGGANDFINYPVLKSAVQTGNTLDVRFDLDAAGSDDGTYRVEFFSNDEATIFGYGPGQTYLGSATVENGTDLVASLNLGATSIVGKALSATASAHSALTTWGYGNTSEFAQNIQVGSDTDFDADGLSDTMEDAAVNDGDGNNDGTLDKLQATVSSYTVGSTPVTFTTSGCAGNGYVSSLSLNSIGHADAGFAYPYGLTDFSLNCSRGDTVDIVKYVFDDNSDELTDYSVRKYRPNTETFEEVVDSTIVRETVGDAEALIMTYSLEDGGPLDDDGVANGVIVDPVGLAHVSTSSQTVDDPDTTDDASTNGSNKKSADGSLASTGANNVLQQFLWAIVMVGVGLMILSAQGVAWMVTKRKS